jgi:Peptidase family C25
VKCYFLTIFIFLCGKAAAQRSYASQSVLSTTTLYKIAIKESGIYKVDLALLNTLGIATANLPTDAIKLYGNTGKMLDEANNSFKYDDLKENAIEVVDGGDGVFNNSDYFIFFGQGVDYWLKDSSNSRFTHQKNLYTKEAYYYIGVSTNGLRITTASNPSVSNTIVNSYNERYFFEENTVNLLSSGKEWLGNEFSNLPGRSLSKTFTVELKNYIVGQPVQLISNVAARSGTSTRFDISVNGTVAQQLFLPPVTGGVLDVFANQKQQLGTYNTNQTTQQLIFNYVPSGSTAQAWLNWFELYTRAQLSMNNSNQLLFRDWNSVSSGNVANFSIANSTNAIQVWDVTEPTQAQKQNVNFNNGIVSFNQSTGYLREYIAFNSNFLQPIAKEKMPVQNLHNSQPVDLIIISSDNLNSEAQRLATHHIQKDNLKVIVVTPAAIYNEFSGGMQDITGIKDFIKMHYDKYKNTATPLKNVLLFGDASYDYLDRINNNTNKVPCWESPNSLDPLQSYVTDDFYGYLDDAESINSVAPALLDIGIGRVPASTLQEAKAYVDKVIQYSAPNALGAWRNQITFVADDEDGNLHLNDAEVLSGTASTTANAFVQQKIYVDAYKQESASGGSRYPIVNEAINNKIFSGNLIWNYSGHGGYRRLADEAILDVDMVSSWTNENKLPLFITATCDFAPYDDPIQFSIGENIILKPKAGGIALMTTTRVVFAYSNRIINNNYLRFAMQRNANQSYNTLGEANRLAKNYTASTSGDIINNRKFTLLGDPAVTIAYPKYFVRTTRINGKPYTQFADTINALENIVIEGEVVNHSFTTFNNFNGKVFLSVYDKPQQVSTLANDPSSIVTNFTNSGNILFKGSANVVNGKFSISFIAPKDMQYNINAGAINYYAQNDTTDANGNDFIMIGGTTNNSILDNEGPQIKAFLNDFKFINGSLTNENPILLVKLSDSSGINTSNIGIGHEITAVIDGDTRNTIVLNDFYEAEQNNYKKGSIQFKLSKLSKGNHQIVIKAWDVFNNSSQFVLNCRVGDDNELEIDRVLNYPNPFTTNTSFWFEHNKPGEDLVVNVKIFTITGKLVKTIKQTINTLGNRSCEINWNGKDDFDDKLAAGVYIYSLSVKAATGSAIIKTEKLMKF